jgi:hypothetical protein
MIIKPEFMRVGSESRGKNGGLRMKNISIVKKKSLKKIIVLFLAAMLPLESGGFICAAEAEGSKAAEDVIGQDTVGQSASAPLSTENPKQTDSSEADTSITTISGAGEYKFDEHVAYHPQKICNLSGKNKKKKEVDIKWKKDPDADFYQLQYSVNKSFKNKKNKKVNGIKCTIKGLGKGKTYYFRVRGYAFSAGYGKWSNKCKVKIKK